MADRRTADPRNTARTGSRAPRGRSGPARPAVRKVVDPAASGEQPAVASGRRTPRLTSRAIVLVLVLAVLVVSYASSAKAYLQQRHEIGTTQSEIAQRQAEIATLQDQVDRWKDPAYVAIQARERFGYVMPGQTAYVALDAQGHKIASTAELGKPSDLPGRTPTAWWTTVWGSVKLAGDPPTTTSTGPATKISPPTSQESTQR